MVNCPVCGNAKVNAKELEAGLKVLHCEKCDGEWISAKHYAAWLATDDTTPREDHPSKIDAKLLVEALYNRAVVIDKLLLSQQQLDNFDKAYRLLELNSKPQNVLAMLLMSFVGEK